MEMGEIVYFSGYVYMPLRETIGVAMMFFVCDVEAGFSSLGVEFKLHCKSFVFKPLVAKAVSD